MAEQEPDDLEKIALHAAKKGLWSERSARDMVQQARIHQGAGGPRVFLRKMMEIKGGLTYDEISKIERDALAPPAPPPPSKPLPSLGTANYGVTTAPEPTTLATPSKSLPRPFDAKKTGTTPVVVFTSEPSAPPPRPTSEIVTPSKALPNPFKKTSSSVPALDTGQPSEQISKKPLPKLGGKKEEPPPASP